MSREAMQLALEALGEIEWSNDSQWQSDRAKVAIAGLRQALETDQEPVAWISDSPTKGNGKQLHWTKSEAWRWSSNITPLYTAPKQWVGLTDQEVMVAAYQAGFDIHEDYENEDDPEAMHWWTPDGEACDDSLLKLRDLIEAKLKEKNT